MNSGGGTTITTVLGSGSNANSQIQFGQFNQQNNQIGGGTNGMNNGFGLNMNQNGSPNININMGSAFPNQGQNSQNSVNLQNQPTFPNSNQPNLNNPNSGFPGTPSMPGSAVNQNSPSSPNPGGQQPAIESLLNKFAPSIPS